MPGSPIDRFLKDPSISEREREALLRDFGLDKPFHIQFIMYIINTVRGNLGISFRYYPNPVIKVIIARIPWTLYLLGISYSLSVIFGVILGALAGWKRGSKIDITVTGLSVITRSMPVFWFGMMLLLIFSFYLGIFPSSGAYTFGKSGNILEYIMDLVWHSILPISTITLILLGPPTLLTRNLIVDISHEQYIYVAKCKGLPWRVILFKHALKNIMLPISSYTATLLGFIVSGAVFTETVFAWPGIGRLFYEAVLARDYPLIQGCLLLTTISVLLANFFADIFYSFIDPRVRQQ
jgi:peptide/nickel transport system permease protein